MFYENFTDRWWCVLMIEKKTASEADDNAVIENMTYDDYLGSVYTYEETSAEAAKARVEAEKAGKLRKSAEEELSELQQKYDDLDKECTKIIDEEIDRRKKAWKKTSDRFDFLISNQKAAAEQTARADIQKMKDKHTSELKKIRSEINDYSDQIKNLDEEHVRLKAERAKYSHFSGKKIQLRSEESARFLQRAKNKKLLTQYQSEMIDQDVKTCESWLSGFDSLETAESDFDNSDFYRELREAKISEPIFTRTANICTVFFALIGAIFSVAAVLFVPNAVTIFFHTAITMLAFGGLFSSVTHVLRKRFAAVRSLPLRERPMLITVFTIGCIPGFFIGEFVLAPSRSAAALFFSIVFCAVCALLFRRLLLTKLSKKLLSRIPYLQDKARKEIFQKYEQVDNGKYNFMMYCYLNHSAVSLYLSIHFAESEHNRITESISVNRTKHSYYEKELAASKKRFRELSNGNAAAVYEQERLKALAEQIAAMESKRPKKPDFELEAKTACAEKTEPLEAEKNEIKTKIEKSQKRLEPLNADYTKKSERAAALKTQKKRTAAALRQWKRTPLPSATKYTLLDTLCFEEKSRISIIRHDLKPSVFRYEIKDGTPNKDEAVAAAVYRYVKGLCKINPRRLIQVNIFDYVTDPNVYINTKAFTGLSKKSVIRGIYSMKDFEIRLFTDADGYKTFKNFFRLQISSMRTIFRENSDSVPQGTQRDIALANRLSGKSSGLFLYQVCIFIVPRENAAAAFAPPKSFIELIRKEDPIRVGLLPVFFTDNSSISPQWLEITDEFNSSDNVYVISDE